MQVTIQLLFCHETAVHEQYILQTPPPCVKPKFSVTHKCHAKIYNPSKELTKTKTYSCKIQRTSYTSSLYFFDTKQYETTVTNDPSPAVELCQDWVSHKRSVTTAHTFKQITKNVWSTTNAIRIQYKWQTITSGFVLNDILTTFISFDDPFKHEMISAGEIMDDCKIDSSYCESRSARIIWTPTAHLTCPHYDGISDGNVVIHYDDKFQGHHLEIPQLDMAIHHLVSCGFCLKNVYPPPIFCDSGKLLIQTTNCSELRKLSRSHIEQSNIHVQQSILRKGFKVYFFEC